MRLRGVGELSLLCDAGEKSEENQKKNQRQIAEKKTVPHQQQDAEGGSLVAQSEHGLDHGGT